jgi:transposase
VPLSTLAADRHGVTIILPSAESGPEAGISPVSEPKLYHHESERQWRHLDARQYQTILHVKPPRSNCGDHGVRVVKMPWAEPSSRFTALFEALATELGKPVNRLPPR